MATTPTNNAVPSESPRDLKFNAGKIDEFVNQIAPSFKYLDRFGNEHLTIAGIENLVRQIVSSLGFAPFGTFEDGATLTDATQTLKYESDGNYYRWDGDFDKVVPADSTPDSTGGVAKGAWINVTDNTLRSALASSQIGNGASLINTESGKNSQQEINTLHSKTSDFVAVSQYPSLSDALLTEKHVLIDTDIVINDIIASNNEGQKIIGFGGKITINTDTGRYRQIHAGCSVESLEIETTGGLYAVTNEANDCTVDSVKFSGACGHYVFSSAGERPKVSNCTVDGIGQITPFVFQNCSDISAMKNTLRNHNGFGIQARWCSGGVISENITINDVIKVSLAAVPAQTVYAFTVAKNYARYGFYIQDANG
ncbi:hypothetical protein ABRP55_20050, partial [Pectobacterium zantedeschiae]